MEEAEEFVKSIDDFKTDAEANLGLRPKIRLWLDKRGSQRNCTQEVLLQYPGSYSELYPELRQTAFAMF